VIGLLFASMIAAPPSIVETLVATSTISDRELDDLIAGRGALPALAAVHQAALEEWSSPEVDWATRARLRGLVPRIDLSAGTDADVDVRDTLDARTTNEGHALGLRVTARFELGDLIFADSELRASRDVAAREAVMRALLEHVTDLYFERLELLVASRIAPSAPLNLRARNIDGMLRALTGGRLDRKDP